jgi:tetratricopeptide (TPR) repeat protein
VLAKELNSRVLEAERLVAAGRHEEALQIAEDGLRRFPTAARLRSVVQYVRRAGSNKRIAQLRTVLETRKDERAYRELVSLNLDLGKLDAAQEIADRYVSEFPAQAEAFVCVGEVSLCRYFGELFRRDAEATIGHLQRALSLNAEALRAHQLLAVLHYGVGAIRSAANHLAEVLALDPTNSRMAELRDQLLQQAGDQEEDIEFLLDKAEETQNLPNDPSVFPGGRRFSVESRGGSLSPKLFASAAAGIGKRLRIEQLAAVGAGGRPIAVAGDNKESFVRLACRLDAAARRAGRHMNFGTMRRFIVEGKFGRIVLVPAGNCAVAARAPRSVPTERVAEGLEMVVTAARAEKEEA